jgi:hypothetical protein
MTIPPDLLVRIVDNAIGELVDEDTLRITQRVKEAERRGLRLLAGGNPDREEN